MKIEGLNSLRFFAFLSIYLFHTTPFFKYGYAGVDFFFVLSSFLLTYLALKEFEVTSGFSKRNFFIRRALRIFPLYFLVLIFSFLILPLAGSYFNYSISLPQQEWMYVFFLSNYDYADSIFALKFLWSIGVEEQFYLLFLISSTFIIKRPLFIIIFLLAVFVLFMLIAEANNFNFYTHTITHFPKFLAGIAGAHLYYKNNYKSANILFLLVVSFVLLFIPQPDLITHLLLSLLFICIIMLAVKYASGLKKNIFYRFTETWGNYTYGLYVYSGFVITFNSKFIHIDNAVLNFAVCLLLLLIVSYLSYHFYEKWFLALKKYFRTVKEI